MLFSWWLKRFSIEESFSKFLKLRCLSRCILFCIMAGLLRPGPAYPMVQYDTMSDAVLLAMRKAIQQSYTPKPVFDSVQHKVNWLSEMSKRLAKRVKDPRERHYLIRLIRYEAQRAGLDPQLVFAVIDTESGFRYDAVSPVGAIGLMQVMPFWTQVLADGESDMLYKPDLNVRIGCLILAHYLEIERGNVERALQRYNGSLGRSVYSDKVLGKLDRYWVYNW